MNSFSIHRRQLGLTRISLAGMGWAASMLMAGSVHAAVLKPYLDRFEPVATDGNIGINRAMNNVWGGHQTRITRDVDGTIHLLYLQQRADTTIQWRLMKRPPVADGVPGSWVQEATGTSGDDVVLLRDPRDERVYVVAYPDGYPAVYASPSFTPVKIPGAWQMLFGSRHYGGTGIGPDGTICLKTSREMPSLIETSVTRTEYACGNYKATSSTTGTWSWTPWRYKDIGVRHGYDFIFPNPNPNPAILAPGLYASASRDVYKDASGIPNYDPNAFAYAFNGVRRYFAPIKYSADTTLLPDTTGYVQTDIAAPLVKTSTVVSAPPERRLSDSVIDSKGRTFSAYYQNDPLNPLIRALKIVVDDSTGKEIFNLDAGPTLPSYGPLRLFEDAKGRMWALWSAAGSQYQSVRLAQLIETQPTGSPPSVWTVGPYTELGVNSNPAVKQFSPYSQTGNMFLAVPRGGTPNALYVDMIYGACNEKYGDLGVGVNFNSSLCYDPVNSKYQRVFYARIRLPD